jgi:hypothetical protein
VVSSVWSKVISNCTTGHSGLGAGPSAVLTKDAPDLHKSLYACANCLVRGSGPSAGAKMEWGEDCVVFGICTTDCSTLSQVFAL